MLLPPSLAVYLSSPVKQKLHEVAFIYNNDDRLTAFDPGQPG